MLKAGARRHTFWQRRYRFPLLPVDDGSIGLPLALKLLRCFR